MEVNRIRSLENGGNNEAILMMATEENSKRLYEASKTGSLQKLKALIQEDPNIIEKVINFSCDAESPLHVSVFHGHLEFTRFLLDRKPELAIEIDADQRTPLHLASANGDIEMVRVLLEKNTSPCSVRDLNGLIPLHHAVIAEKIEIMKELINARPQSVWAKLHGCQTVLHLCVEYNCMEAMEFLMELVIQDQTFFNAIDDSGNTILDLSLMLRRIEIIRYLVHVPGIKTGTNYSLDSSTTTANVLRRRTRNLEIQQTENVVRGRQQQQPPPDELSASPPKKQPSCYCWKVLMNCLKYKGDWLAEVQGTLMLVASVIATMSFQGITTPPGGVWQSDYPPPPPPPIFSSVNATEIVDYLMKNKSIYKTGTAVMATIKHQNYGYYLIVNNFSFLASVGVILLIISGFPLKNRIGTWLLKLAMCAAVGFLSLSYLLGMTMVNLPKSIDSGRDISIYLSTIFLWFCPLVIVGFCYIIWFLIWVLKIFKWVLKRIFGMIFNSKLLTKRRPYLT